MSHLLLRYTAGLINGAKNPYQIAVVHDITHSIIKTKAIKGTPATYWKHKEQIEKMQITFNKWVVKGNVWSAAATKVSSQ